MLPALDFAQATLPHESTGLTPYELELSFPPRMSYNWREQTREPVPPNERMTREEAVAYAERAHKIWQHVREALRTAQQRQKAQADRSRREPNFSVGDFVYVSRKGWQTDRPSVKLDLQAAGPFKILEKVGHLYRLELPAHMHIHDVLHADRLRKAPMNPLEGQDQEPQPPIEVDGQQEWEVQEILASRVINRKL